ncbi:hypothetical protein PanWU01x14_229270 [Parasponia andersonii]|uniref:Uncharacterized protein n=1 Tax=Parasponia andersonii TaxID=3476 RepID=A0A2P5BLE5_PARAD|nr:hypothetical protein PanWU01x14_229270 [Parasponia andersonii]
MAGERDGVDNLPSPVSTKDFRQEGSAAERPRRRVCGGTSSEEGQHRPHLLCCSEREKERALGLSYLL